MGVKNYFYTDDKSLQGEAMFNTLTLLLGSQEIIRIPEGSEFSPASIFNLRSGDLIIVFVQSAATMDKIIALQNVLEPFRLIIVLGRDIQGYERKMNCLRPRFVGFEEDSVEDLVTVIKKLQTAY